MNIALIQAGGVGSRMEQHIPKQFLNIFDKPLVIYTLEAFQAHPEIDAIAVVCVDGWQEVLRAYCRQFGIAKLESVIPGGENGQASIKSGLLDIQKRHGPETLVMIHEAVRPMVSPEVIGDSLRVCREYGGAVAAIPCHDAMMETADGGLTAATQIPRERLVRAQNPHTYPLGTLLEAHREAEARGIRNSVATSTLMVELGRTLHFSKGSEKNFKFTTLEDLEIFQAMLQCGKPGWLR